MPRSVNAVASRARRKKILKLAKGYFGRKKNVWTVAKGQVEKGMGYAYRDRRTKKREFRGLWIQRINAGARAYGYSYSQLMGNLGKAGIDLNRKVLADLAMNHEQAFKAVVDLAMTGKIAASVKPAVEKASKPAKSPKKSEKSGEPVAVTVPTAKSSEEE